MSLSLSFDHLPVKSIGALNENFPTRKAQMGGFYVDIGDVQAHVNNILDAIGCLPVVVSLIIYSSKNTRINENDLPITFIRRAVCVL